MTSTGASPIERHFMEQVIAGGGLQKEEDISALKTYGNNYHGH